MLIDPMDEAVNPWLTIKERTVCVLRYGLAVWC